MQEFQSLRHQFLIAMPQQHDAHFNEALIYICEHEPDRAMGLIVNKPLPLDLNALAKQMKMETKDVFVSGELSFKRSVFYGGPCETDHGFILHTGGQSWSSTMEIDEGIFLSSSKDILEDIAKLKGPDYYLLALGYAGWDAGQLESEMAANVWLNVETDFNTLFDTLFLQAPQLRWQHAAASLGVDIHLLSTEAGKA